MPTRGVFMRILVVEDDEASIKLLEVTLRAFGHQTVVARDGQEAMKILREQPIRFVISDWEMPTMTGPELCRAIRAADLGRYIYTILLTARSGDDAIVDGLTAGADDFVSKPFKRQELALRIRTGERIVGLETRDLTIFAMARLAES